MYTWILSGDSRANVEIAGAAKTTTTSHSSAAGQEPIDLPVFVKYLLRQRYSYPHLSGQLLTIECSDNKQQTSMLLIDFNRAELLNRKQSSEHPRIGRTVSCVLTCSCELPSLY